MGGASDHDHQQQQHAHSAISRPTSASNPQMSKCMSTLHEFHGNNLHAACMYYCSSIYIITQHHRNLRKDQHQHCISNIDTSSRHKHHRSIDTVMLVQLLHCKYSCNAQRPACRQAGTLTVQPASEATGPSFLLMEPPALNKAMSTPAKLQLTQD